MTQRKEHLKEFIPHVCNILKIEESPDWTILHKDGDYVHLHYIDRPKTDFVKFGHLRGTIVDLEKEETVRQTFSYEVECVHESLPIDEKGTITLVPIDERNGSRITLLKGNYSLHLGHEGVVVDVWKDKNGKIHLSTLRHININESASRQAESLTYYHIYQELGLPDPEILFDKKKLTSPFVHTFILSHPSLFSASKEPIGTGYGVYLGYKKMDRSDDPEITEQEAVDINAVVSNITRRIKHIQESKEKLIYFPSKVNVKTADSHLRYGHYIPWEDNKVPQQIRSGEFVIITDHITGRTIRVLSPSYLSRWNVRGKNKYLLYNFHKMAYYANIKNKNKNNDHFTNGMFPHLNREDLSQIRQRVTMGNPVLRLLGTEPLNLNNYNDRLTNIWLIFLLSVPIHQQADVLDIIHRYQENIMRGAEAAMIISKPQKKSESITYDEEVVKQARYLSYLNPTLRKKLKEEGQLQIIIERLRKMRPDQSYTRIRTFIKEIDRVNRLKQKSE